MKDKFTPSGHKFDLFSSKHFFWKGYNGYICIKGVYEQGTLKLNIPLTFSTKIELKN